MFCYVTFVIMLSYDYVVILIILCYLMLYDVILCYLKLPYIVLC